MSLILDALRKLDREKSSRRSATANIAIEILRPDLSHPRKRTPLYLAVVSLTVVATAVITYAVIVQFSFLSKSSPSAPLNPPARSQQAAPAPLEFGLQSKPLPSTPVNPPVPSQQVKPAPFSREPVRDVRDKLIQVPQKIETPPESKTLVESKKPETSLSEEKPGQNVIVEKTDVATEKTKKTAESIPSGSAITPPSLKLSAIVWYEEPSKRFAMINGNIATEGSVIEGVKVVEIYPDRVRFSHNNQSFEIPINR
jgi:general secretion pathway protein B